MKISQSKKETNNKWISDQLRKAKFEARFRGIWRQFKRFFVLNVKFIQTEYLTLLLFLPLNIEN